MKKTKTIETWSRSKVVGEDTWDITLFEHKEKGRNDLISPHKHDFYLILFIEQGHGVHEIDFLPLTVKPYQVHFLRPQQVHYWKLAEDTVGHQLMFAANAIHFVNRLSALPFFQLNVPSVLELTAQEYAEVRQELTKLLQLLPDKDSIGQEISALQFSLLLKKIQRYYIQTYPAVEAQVKDAKIQAFKALLEVHFKTDNQVAFYADKLNITPNYLNIRTQKILGISASTCIQRRIILEAERLLITTDLSVKEIAFELGFEDTGYFNRYFKKWNRKTPGQFRSGYNLYNKVP
ncbi:AraC family transcriptional regulator [Myroides fluvii]|uniref:AraC family transcriptional regulator n=1 Tax=Myroides fluvii TaxID=2572594 RepID=UPI00131DD586|nr:helix-turn-helix domain-containing protein [Myroides fluvii]